VSSGALRSAFEAAKSALGFAAHGCTTCGGLREGGTSILVMEDGQQPSRCKGCGLALDADGKPVGMRLHDGRIDFTLIWLCASPPEPVGDGGLGRN